MLSILRNVLAVGIAAIGIPGMIDDYHTWVVWLEKWQWYNFLLVGAGVFMLAPSIWSLWKKAFAPTAEGSRDVAWPNISLAFERSRQWLDVKDPKDPDDFLRTLAHIALFPFYMLVLFGAMFIPIGLFIALIYWLAKFVTG